MSYTFQLPNATQEQADMFAMLMGDLGYENQEAVISSNYLNAAATNADALEHIIKFNDAKGVEEALEKAGINDYTLDLTKKEVKVLDFEMGSQELLDKIVELVNELGENYNESKTSKIASRYLDRTNRKNFYKSWLETRENSERNRVLRDYTIEASNRVNQEIAKIEKQQQSIKDNTQNKDIRYSKNKYKTTNEIKLQAELKQKKVYSYKEVDTMVNDFINTFTSSKNKYFKNSKESVVKQFFTELNTGNVNANKLANDLSNLIFNYENYSNMNNFFYKVLIENIKLY